MDKVKKDEPNTKRAMISKDSQLVLIFAVIASAVVSACGVLGWSFMEDIIYNGKIISELNTTNDALKENKIASEKIRDELGKLNDDNVLKELRASSDDSALQVILDAMPTQDNRTDLAASLQNKILSRSGALVQSFNVNEAASSKNRTNLRGAATAVSGAQPIEFSVVLLGDEATIQSTLRDIERTIRPLVVTNLTINSGPELRVTITARTFYNPLIEYVLTDKKVER
ncbi:hypothetical protein FWF93_03325 [Candidatus Saccharibacteria bacterium]|nr:hypothetical protein [Candidatus Saccharibacteria bacterium]